MAHATPARLLTETASENKARLRLLAEQLGVQSIALPEKSLLTGWQVRRDVFSKISRGCSGNNAGGVLTRFDQNSYTSFRKTPNSFFANPLPLDSPMSPPSMPQPPDAFLSKSPQNLLLTASFGHLIPTSLLATYFEPLNALNVHPSLLPRWRGAAPIQWSILAGDVEGGVTVQELSRGRFDRGRILAQEHVGPFLHERACSAHCN